MANLPYSPIYKLHMFDAQSPDGLVQWATGILFLKIVSIP